MSAGIDILHLFPTLAAIGQQQLQCYCNQWLLRPIAREYAVAHITVDDELLMHISVASSGPVMSGDRAVIPIDELLGYIIDRHFEDADDRRDLHSDVREARRRYEMLNRDYEVSRDRRGTLYLTCKNPACCARMESTQEAYEGQAIDFGPVEIQCLTCGHTDLYYGRDFRLKLED